MTERKAGKGPSFHDYSKVESLTNSFDTLRFGGLQNSFTQHSPSRHQTLRQKDKEDGNEEQFFSFQSKKSSDANSAYGLFQEDFKKEEAYLDNSYKSFSQLVEVVGTNFPSGGQESLFIKKPELTGNDQRNRVNSLLMPMNKTEADDRFEVPGSLDFESMNAKDGNYFNTFLTDPAQLENPLGSLDYQMSHGSIQNQAVQNEARHIDDVQSVAEGGVAASPSKYLFPNTDAGAEPHAYEEKPPSHDQLHVKQQSDIELPSQQYTPLYRQTERSIFSSVQPHNGDPFSASFDDCMSLHNAHLDGFETQSQSISAPKKNAFFEHNAPSSLFNKKFCDISLETETNSLHQMSTRLKAKRTKDEAKEVGIRPIPTHCRQDPTPSNFHTMEASLENAPASKQRRKFSTVMIPNTSLGNGQHYVQTRMYQPIKPDQTSKSSQPLSMRPRDGWIGSYCPKSRKVLLENYLKKRKNRVWTKKIRYSVRKTFADSRLRVKGRFISKEDEARLREGLMLLL